MAWIALEDAKRQLNKTANIDDVELSGFVDAACAIVEDLKGHVAPASFTERRTALNDRGRRRSGAYRSQWFLEVTETPILSVASLNRVYGATWSPVSLDSIEVGDGIVRVSGPGDYLIGYVAGRADVPPNFRLAALELVTHLWRGSQLNQNSGRPQLNGDQMAIVPGSASALPYRVRELLGIYGEVVSDHVVIA